MMHLCRPSRTFKPRSVCVKSNGLTFAKSKLSAMPSWRSSKVPVFAAYVQRSQKSVACGSGAFQLRHRQSAPVGSGSYPRPLGNQKFLFRVKISSCCLPFSPNFFFYLIIPVMYFYLCHITTHAIFPLTLWIIRVPPRCVVS